MCIWISSTVMLIVSLFSNKISGELVFVVNAAVAINWWTRRKTTDLSMNLINQVFFVICSRCKLVTPKNMHLQPGFISKSVIQKNMNHQFLRTTQTKNLLQRNSDTETQRQQSGFVFERRLLSAIGRCTTRDWEGTATTKNQTWLQPQLKLLTSQQSNFLHRIKFSYHLSHYWSGDVINISIERIRQTTIWQSTFSSICIQINITRHIWSKLDATNINRVNGVSSQPHVNNSTQFQRLTLAATVSPTTSIATTLQARHHQLFTWDTSGRISQNVQTTRSRATHSTCTQDQEQLDKHGQRHQHK